MRGWRAPSDAAPCSVSYLPCRDRSRGALFGNVDAEDTSHYDPEKLERANDSEIDHLSERAKHLKQAREGDTLRAAVRGVALTSTHPQVTLNIQGEVDSHLRLLDSLVRAGWCSVLFAPCLHSARVSPPHGAGRSRLQGSDMDHTRGSVGGTMDRFRKVMEVKSNRSLAYVVGGVVLLFLLLRVVL